MSENVAYVQKNLQEMREQSMKFSPGRKSSKQRKLQCRGHVQKVGETCERDNQTDQRVGMCNTRSQTAEIGRGQQWAAQGAGHCC